MIISIRWVCTLIIVTALAPEGGPARSSLAQHGETWFTAPVQDAELDSLIKDLGDPSYDKRTYATRRLCAAGAAAREKLQHAERHPCPEIALRAAAVRAVLDQLWFSGATIQLALSQPKARWDEPVDLLLTVTNPTTGPARAPFDLHEARSVDGDDARQVADMLDAAEWLRVRTAAGRQIDLRVDDVSANPKVAEVVHERVSGGPVGVISPGQSVTLQIRAFNRGWARFPLLDRGDYVITLDYVPAWEDEVLAAVQAGRVASNSVTLTIVDSAPEAVSRRGVETTLALERGPGGVVARLTNRTDHRLHVNKNFGNSPPFAQGRWVFERENVLRELPLTSKPVTSWHDFEPALLQAVEPGDSIELARISTDELRERLLQAGANVAAGDGEIYFGYSNLLTRQWQLRQQEQAATDPTLPSILREPLPRTMFGGWHTTNRMRLFEPG